MRPSIVVALLTVIWGAGLGLAQETAAKPPAPNRAADRLESSPELDAIRAGSQAFVAAFNKADAKAVAALWTEDGQYSDDTGRVLSGREAICKAYAEFFADHPGAQMRVVVDSVRLLSPEAAIEDGRAMVALKPDVPSGISSYTAVHVRVDGKWLMATVRDAPGNASSPSQHAADLEWLVGTWVAEEHGVKTESVCSWVAGKSFLERKHTTTRPDGTTASGVQLIGFNPQGGHVQSWSFTSDGGHAIGVWVPIEGGWQAKVYGIAGDGSSTAAVNVLRRLDDNAYVWQSVQRFVGESALPDTDEIVIKRRPAAK
jgi:uncharacterized protein (TIGR02246 family)